MKKLLVFLTCLFVLSGHPLFSQQITYSEPDREDARVMNFEVLGKVDGNIMVYKSYRDVSFMCAFDNGMKMTEKHKLDFLPERTISSDFQVYPGFIYMFYQYQRKNVFYCMAAKIDSKGKKIGDPIQLDTTSNMNYSSTRNVYTILFSEDKQKIMVFKVSSRNDKMHILSTVLFDKDLNVLKRSRVGVEMPQRNDFLSEFILDNDGDVACIRASGTAQNDNINKVTLVTKKAYADIVQFSDLSIKGIYLDDIRIKADNLNRHYIVTSYFSKQRRGNIDGLYYYLWDKDSQKEILNTTTAFTDEFRSDARNDGNTKTAFNDFFLSNIILRKDGGFIVISESVYSSSRGNTLSRWDYLYGGVSPFWSSPIDYYTWNSPLGFYPWWRTNSFNNNMTRYYADNVTVISFDKAGKMEWSNVIRKSQYDDNSDNFIGFGVLNGGDKLHFLFNVQEKRDNILSDQSIAPNGQINRNPTFKNLDRGYNFMPRHAKQVGARQLIIPCQYRGYTCFAKIDY